MVPVSHDVPLVDVISRSPAFPPPPPTATTETLVTPVGHTQEYVPGVVNNACPVIITGIDLDLPKIAPLIVDNIGILYLLNFSYCCPTKLIRITGMFPTSN